MRSQKTITKCSILSFTPAVTCCMCLDLVKGLLIWYSLKVDKTATQLHCQGASHLVRSAICDRSTCKSFRVPPFTLLHELYNSVYCNYVIVMQRLVGWFWGQGKKGVCIDKKLHCGPTVCSVHIGTPLLRRPCIGTGNSSFIARCP